MKPEEFARYDGLGLACCAKVDNESSRAPRMADYVRGRRPSRDASRRSRPHGTLWRML